MSFWNKLQRGWQGWRARRDVSASPDEDDERQVSEPEPEAPDSSARDPEGELARLSRAGDSDGASVTEAIGILRRARGTAREAETVNAAMRGVGHRRIAEPIRVACADILAMRGDDEQAARLLEGVTSVEGLVLAADLFAAKGQLARAVGTIERVLARDIDAPGARERHGRWRAALGGNVARPRRTDEVTLVAASSARGPFRLLREAARGGAGAVYEAEDEVLGRRVAYKVYHGRGADHGAVEREARLASALAGPGVIRVFDAAPDEGWVALEWIPRGSVRDMLKLGDMAPLTSIDRWARSLAHAIARVHAAGFVHADVKPANVLLRQLGEAVLGDFGIARRFGEPAEGGSPGYLSPERLGGRASDPSDDVYGYGRILEDVLHRSLPQDSESARESGAGDALDSWRHLALRCIGPDDSRPRDGDELVRALP